jgi:peptidyl-prolyl cis-trans isomerase SurA
MLTRSPIRGSVALLLALVFASPALAEEWKSGAEPTANSDSAATPAATSGQPAAASGLLVDGIAAQVGTEVVLVSDVHRIADPIEAKIRAQGATDADIALLRSDVLDKLIERKMIGLLAKRVEIEATDFEIDDAIAGIARENDLDAEGLKKSVESQGLSFDAYRRRIAEEIVQQKVLGGMVRSRVKIEDAQIRKLYDQRYGAMPAGGEEVHLVHMAAGAEDGKPRSVAAACDKVRRGLARVRAGESFESVASQVSQASPDLGWLPAGALAPWMQEAAAGLEPGQVSGVIELPVGCAVVQLVERRKIEALSFEQAKPQLQELMMEQAFQEEYVRFVERLKKQTYVERKGAFADASRLDVASPPPTIR